MTEEVQDWVFTFGLGYFSAPARYVKIRGTYEGARTEMIRRFGNRWAFQYADEEAAGVQRWGLQEITEEQMILLGMLAKLDEEKVVLEERVDRLQRRLDEEGIEL